MKKPIILCVVGSVLLAFGAASERDPDALPGVQRSEKIEREARGPTAEGLRRKGSDSKATTLRRKGSDSKATTLRRKGSDPKATTGVS